LTVGSPGSRRVRSVRGSTEAPRTAPRAGTRAVGALARRIFRQDHRRSHNATDPSPPTGCRCCPAGCPGTCCNDGTTCSQRDRTAAPRHRSDQATATPPSSTDWPTAKASARGPGYA
jgi:hypothetical protein